MSDYLEMCKPKVVVLMLITTAVGVLLATPKGVPWATLVWTLLGVGFLAAAAAVLNHLADHRIDALMRRTENRPVPTGRVSAREALIFAVVLMIFGLAVLVTFVNLLTAALTFLSLVGYAYIYTRYLKYATPQNIVIGGAAGATPPLLGWVAVTNSLDPQALLLFLIIFIWTPPHFWALALHRQADYAKANVPMLPVTHGEAFTKLHVSLYTCLMVIVSFLPFLTGMSGRVYAAGALLLAAWFCYRVWVLQFKPEAPMAALRVFTASIYYLFLIFIFLLVDHYV